MEQLLLFVVFVLLFLLNWTQKAKGPGPPTYPGALPVLGHSHMLLGSCIEIWDTMKKLSHYALKVGGVARFCVVGTSFYFITDPDDFLTVMNNCLDTSYVYGFANEWIANGLATPDVLSWQRSRKLFSAAFSQSALYRFVDSFNSASRQLVHELNVEAGKGQFDHHPYIINNLLETSNETILGLKNENNNMINKAYVNQIDNLFDMFAERLQKVWLHSSFFFNKSDLKKRQNITIDKIKALSYAMIQKRKSELLEEKYGCKDTTKTVLDLILEFYSNKDGSDDGIRNHMEIFLLASFRTTGSILVFATKSIGSHSDVQIRIHQELDAVFGDSNRDVEKDDLPKLTYLEAVIKETMRLYPAIPIIARDAHSAIKLKNYTIPRGTTCVGSIYGLNRHPAWGEDAEQFKPERWLESKCIDEGFFASFGFGRRSCIGALYAIILMKISLVHICRRYRIIASKTEAVIKCNSFLIPVSGHKIALELRSNSC